jgi:hypothetical protein
MLVLSPMTGTYLLHKLRPGLENVSFDNKNGAPV